MLSLFRASIILLLGLMFVINCGATDTGNSGNSGNDSNSQTEYPIYDPYVFTDAQRPQKVELNSGWQGYNFYNLLIIEFDVVAGVYYSFDYSAYLTDSVNRSSYSIDRLEAIIVSPTGEHKYHHGGTIRDFIAQKTGTVSVIFKAENFYLPDVMLSLAVKIDSYLPDIGQILPDSGWHEYDSTSSPIQTTTIPVIAGDFYAINWVDERACQNCTNANTYTGNINITIRKPDNQLLYAKTFDNAVFKTETVFYNGNITGNLNITSTEHAGFVSLNDTYALEVRKIHPASVNFINQGDKIIYINDVTIIPLNLTAGNTYLLKGTTQHVGTPSTGGPWGIVSEDGTWIYENSSLFWIDDRLAVSRTGIYYLVILPVTEGYVKFNIAEIQSTPIAVDSGWQSVNISSEREYKIDVAKGKKYTISWDDVLDGSGTTTGNVKTTLEYSDGTSIATDIDNGYTVPQFFVADRDGQVKIILKPTLAGTVGLSVASSTSSAITIDGGWAQYSSVLTNYKQTYSFDVIKGNTYTIRLNSGGHPSLCPSSSGYTSWVSIQVFYADQAMRFQNQLYGGNYCIIELMGYTFVAPGTGKIIIEATPRSTGTYALRVDNTTSPVFNANTGWQTVFVDSTLSFTTDLLEGNGYIITWEDMLSANSYTSRAVVDGYTNQTEKILSSTSKDGLYNWSGTNFNEFQKQYVASYLPTTNGKFNIIINGNNSDIGLDEPGNMGYLRNLGLNITSVPITHVATDGSENNVIFDNGAFLSFNATAGRYYKIKIVKSSIYFRMNLLNTTDMASLMPYDLFGVFNYAVIKALKTEKVYVHLEGNYNKTSENIVISVMEY